MRISLECLCCTFCFESHVAFGDFASNCVNSVALLFGIGQYCMFLSPFIFALDCYKMFLTDQDEVKTSAPLTIPVYLLISTV